MNDMADTDAGDTSPVFRLIYRSHSLIADDERREELGAIFTTARRSNRGRGITGALMITDTAFVQALEGEEDEVRALFRKISYDPRHEEVAILEEGDTPGRTFGRWAMAKVSADDGPDIRLLSNARRGTIVAAPGVDTSITPEQEAILAFMREALTVGPLGA